MTCSRCAERGKTWSGSDPKCAFLPDGTFTPDNWMCATMVWLRQSAAYSHRNADDCSVSVTRAGSFSGALSSGDGYVVCSYYKDRGCTPVAMFMRDDECRPLLLSDVQPASEPKPVEASTPPASGSTLATQKDRQ